MHVMLLSDGIVESALRVCMDYYSDHCPVWAGQWVRQVVVTVAEVMAIHKNRGITVDTGMVVVIFISIMYIIMVIILLFYVKNDWCDLLFNNMTVSMK